MEAFIARRFIQFEYGLLQYIPWRHMLIAGHSLLEEDSQLRGHLRAEKPLRGFLYTLLHSPNATHGSAYSVRSTSGDAVQDSVNISCREGADFDCPVSVKMNIKFA